MQQKEIVIIAVVVLGALFFYSSGGGTDPQQSLSGQHYKEPTFCECYVGPWEDLVVPCKEDYPCGGYCIVRLFVDAAGNYVYPGMNYLPVLPLSQVYGRRECESVSSPR